jgi:nucleoid DNA-binding protein
MMTITDIAKLVAGSVGSEQGVAYGFVRAVFEQMAAALDSGAEIRIRGLGRFYWRPFHKTTTVTGSRRRTYAKGMKLRFDPSEQLRKRRKIMSEDGMTKLGVVLDDQKTKTATNEPESEERVCPLCGKTLDDAGACPEHGTEPFEPDTAP